MIAVRAIGTEDTIAIRHSVLRSGMDVESCYWDQDNDKDTFHLGGYYNTEHAGVCTFQRQTHPLTGEAQAYRLRGMAVRPEYRGQGIAALMLAVGEDRLLRSGVEQAWLYARTGAAGFYERYGWEINGDMFEIPTAGPHFLMVKTLRPHICG